MVEAGYVRHVGLSETIRRAHAAHPICDLQIEYSLISRGIENEILPACRELGITAYGVLSRGLLSGHWSKERQTGSADFRSHAPRFSAENLDRNLELVEALRGVVEAKDASVAQVAIAWVLSRGEDIVVLVGARTRGRFAESLCAIDVELSADDLAAIEAAYAAVRSLVLAVSRSPPPRRGPKRRRPQAATSSIEPLRRALWQRAEPGQAADVSAARARV